MSSTTNNIPYGPWFAGVLILGLLGGAGLITLEENWPSGASASRIERGAFSVDVPADAKLTVESIGRVGSADPVTVEWEYLSSQGGAPDRIMGVGTAGMAVPGPAVFRVLETEGASTPVTTFRIEPPQKR